MTQSRLRPIAATRTPVFAWSPQPHARTLSLPEQIASSVGNAIIEGTYEAGKRILEQQLAADFQVSRGPVREALRILEREGLIRLQARRGAQVAQFDAEELRQIFQVRASLIGLAARLATELQNKAYIARLKHGVARAVKLARDEDEMDPYVSAVTQLNLGLAAASGNKYLENIIFSLANQTLRYTRLGLATKARRQQSSKNWKRLQDAIERNDPDAAASVAEGLVIDSRNAALALIGRYAAKPARRARS